MKTKLASWTLAHFAVDMSCFYILFRGVETVYRAGEPDLTAIGIAIMVYNCIAFGLQMVFGNLADKHPRIERAFGAVGLALMVFPLVVIGSSQSETASWIALIFCALLNAAFHVGGGMDVLKKSNGKIAPSGIFVSSGALGVILGTMYGKTGHGALLPLAIVIAASIFLYFSADKQSESNIPKIKPFAMLTKYGVGFVAFSLFIAVFIRSYAGIIWPIGFEKTGLLILLPAVSSCLGKALGGIVADRFGAMETAVTSLALSIAMLFLGNGSWIATGMAILLFNMAMPITLCGLASAMPNHCGFAFGLSTFALLLGYIAYTVTASNDVINTNLQITITLLGITAIVLIALSLRSKKVNRHESTSLFSKKKRFKNQRHRHRPC